MLPHIELVKAAGHEVRVLHVEPEVERTRGTSTLERFAAGGEGAEPVLRQDQAAHIRCSMEVGPFTRTRWWYRRTIEPYTRALFRLYEFAVQEWGRPDLLHAHVSLPGGVASARLSGAEKVPVVVSEHYTGFESDAKYPWRLGSVLREMGDSIDGFYPVSPAFADRIRATGVVEVSGVIPNPIDTDFFDVNLERRKAARSESDFRIVTTGTCGERKGTDVLLKALRYLNKDLPWSVSFFGNASLRDSLLRTTGAAEYADRLFFEGSVSQAELRSAFQIASLFVVSSRVETANVSMLQAAACGVPVVSTCCGGPESLLGADYSLLARSDDPEDLAQQITLAAEKFAELDPLIPANQVQHKFGIAAVGELLNRAYSDALEGYASRTGLSCLVSEAK